MAHGPLRHLPGHPRRAARDEGGRSVLRAGARVRARRTSMRSTTRTRPVAVIDDPRTAAVADLFDAIYETTLQALARYFVHTTESNEQVGPLARTAMRLMERALKPLGIALTGLPLTEDPAGPRAGPGFTIVSPTFYLLPHRNAAWRVLRQRIAMARFAPTNSPRLPRTCRISVPWPQPSTSWRRSSPRSCPALTRPRPTEGSPLRREPVRASGAPAPGGTGRARQAAGR